MFPTICLLLERSRNSAELCETSTSYIGEIEIGKNFLP